ncbi:NYN domain-containing protein [Nocardioides sp. TF02-7]|uniref:NYN domain-containing protein n=1 Tax=Nocardioides sp. TF02-7 TaxID=2917724 RepID=UPI001F0557D5|nr:NYN domain-containing protein [Nocardioides sp. TF02-7]UMG93516.1 NYN domain-containing protein [Nocardioides sp. TF02-7]
MTTPRTRVAVLIDADNTSPKHASALLDELAKYGVATVKRAYGDWTTTQLGGWKAELNKHAIAPVQQFSYTTGKNSTDSALIIDAMDLLYSGNLDAFAIVSSDSDFTRLATRLRESGKTVYGLGLRKTPASLVAACDKFIYLEVLGDGPDGTDDDGGHRWQQAAGRRRCAGRRRPTAARPPPAAHPRRQQHLPRRRLGPPRCGRHLPELGRGVVRPAQLRLPQADRPGGGTGLPRGRERGQHRPGPAQADRPPAEHDAQGRRQAGLSAPTTYAALSRAPARTTAGRGAPW